MELQATKVNKSEFVAPEPNKIGRSKSASLDVTKESVFLSEVIYDGQYEQGVEFDYVLPDYYPDIFKILKCSLTPCIISYSISGNQLYCDGVAYIKVLYLSRENNIVNCVEQRYTYSKTIDLGYPAATDALRNNAVVYLTPKTDYCNGRAVSGRRIDVRGAVSCKIKVTCARESGMITGANGMGIETRRTSLNYCGEKLIASRQFVTREEIETGTGTGGISNIVHHDVSVAVTDYKLVANKIVIKGEAHLKALYLIKAESAANADVSMSNDNAYNSDNADNADISGNSDSVVADPNSCEAAEVMEATIPLSQIIDLPGVTEQHICFVNLSVMDCDLEIKPDENGDNRVFSCDLTVDCGVTAHLEKEVMPVIDMYSVDYESSFTKTVIKTESMPQIIERQLSIKGSVECGEGNLEAVYDARCDLSNIVCRVRPGNSDNTDGLKPDGELVITGQANMQIIGRLDNNTPVFAEKTEPFELSTEVPDLTDEHGIEPNLQVVNTTYSISSDNRVELRVVLKLNGCLYQMRSIEVIKEISINEDAPKSKNTEYALKLYYAEANEDVWNIAKRYNTGAEAIITENDMESDKITTPCMLLIPIV